MALDGVMISGIVDEIRNATIGGRIDKVYMPEKDEVILAIRSHGSNRRLLLSANSSHPRVHFTQHSKDNPMKPPLFCMVLRKHIGGGKIVDILQPDFERILELHIESPDELGDLSVKRLIIELMGKHSNIILVGRNILDSAKRVSREISSVREVLPGAVYIRPPGRGKKNPLFIEYSEFSDALRSGKLQDAILSSLSGISPIMASELCSRSGIAADTYGDSLSTEQVLQLWDALQALMEDIKNGRYSPEMILSEKNAPVEFSAVELSVYNGYQKRYFETISELLECYYAEKDRVSRMSQKTVDLRRLIKQAIERASRKKDLHIKTLREIKTRDELRVWGELLTANIYALKLGMTSFTTQNFYDENQSEITIPLDPVLTPVENAQAYFNRYSKQKRTYTAVCEQMKQTDDELNYLEAVLTSLASCVDDADIDEIREELAEQGFVKKRRMRERGRKSKPLMYLSADGFEIYVGKNNKQNDELTLKFAENNDLWFHAKDIPGSHVIVRTNGNTPPDSTLNEAANYAAYYSKARNGSHVPVDYTLRRNVKKPSGAKPGMVIYDNYKTAYITPVLSNQ